MTFLKCITLYQKPSPTQAVGILQVSDVFSELFPLTVGSDDSHRLLDSIYVLDVLSTLRSNYLKRQI